MEENTRIKLIIAGLILASFAVGYFIVTQKFKSDVSQQEQQTDITSTVFPSSLPAVIDQDLGQLDVQMLPQTGVPMPILTSLALSAAISGFFLRKFPN